MANIIDIFLKIKDQASTGLQNFQNELKKSGEAGKFLSENLGKLSIAGAVTGLVSYTNALVQNTKSLAIEAKELSNVSIQTGFATETIQSLGFATESIGIDSQDARDALRDLNFEIGDAFRTGGEAEKKFTDLGISIRDSSGHIRNNDQVLRDLSDALSKIENPAEKAASLARVLGEDNQKLIPIIGQGAEAFDNYTRSLKSMGGFLDETAISNLQEFNRVTSEIAASQRELQIQSIDSAVAAAKLTEIWTLGFNERKKDIVILTDIFSDFTDFLGITNNKIVDDLNKQNKLYELQKQEIQQTAKASEEQKKEEEKRLKALQKDQVKYNNSVAKLREEFSKEISADGLDDVSTALQKNDQFLNDIIKKYGVELPEAFDVYNKRNKEVMDKSSERVKDFNNDLQDQIDELKAASAVFDSDARALREGIARRGVDTEISELRKTASEQGITDTSQIDELEALKIKELEDSFREAGKEIDKVNDSVKSVRDSSSEADTEIKSLSDSIENVGESSEKAAGGLSKALAGMDAVGALAFEFQGAGQRNTGASAFGTTGVANDVESLLLVADRARAEALRELISKGQTGQVDFGADKLAAMIAEFNKLSEQLGGLGTIGGGTGRSGASFGDSKVEIVFNPEQDFDNLSVQSQRQLAEQIGAAIS